MSFGATSKAQGKSRVHRTQSQKWLIKIYLSLLFLRKSTSFLSYAKIFIYIYIIYLCRWVGILQSTKKDINKDVVIIIDGGGKKKLLQYTLYMN